MNIFRLFESKKIMKIAPKHTTLHHSKFFFRGSMSSNPPIANAWLRHASQAPK